jgi:hypothetical protein
VPQEVVQIPRDALALGHAGVLLGALVRLDCRA